MTDIDGEHSCLYKKKRRLRLFLITSRLSPQFSHPASNIVDRGSSKIAVWAKQKSLGRNLLRKAAILNRIRRRAISAKEKEEEPGAMFVDREQEQKQLELAKLALIYGSHDPHARPVPISEFPPMCDVETEDSFETPQASPSTTPSPSSSPPAVSDELQENTPVYQSPNDAYSYSPPKTQIPRRSYIPLPPSPLGLSNYDAFDIEDDLSYAQYDDDEESDMDEPHSPSATTSASYTSTLPAGTGSSEVRKTPPQMLFCDFNILDPEEPVMGDYDQVDEGANAIWPNPSAEESSSQPLLPASSSPNFSALFATSAEKVGPFSPNFAAVEPEEPTQGQGQGQGLDQKQGQWPGQPSGVWGIAKKEKEKDIEQERNRQRNFMFLKFNS